MQIQISWLLQKPTDLDLHCLKKAGYIRFSRTRVISPKTLFITYFLPICLSQKILGEMAKKKNKKKQ